MTIITDARGKKFTPLAEAGRIISLVPSLTEYILDLGFPAEQMIGRTAFCKYPSNMLKKIASVGGTKKVNLKKIQKLKPDLIIANQEENTAEMVKVLENGEMPQSVFVTRTESLIETMTYLEKLAKLLQLPAYNEFLSRWKHQKGQIHHIASGSVAYFIWKNPWMVAGKNTYISSILEFLGFENYFEEMEFRYPIVEPKETYHLNPDYIFLSSEPYNFKPADILEIQQKFNIPDSTKLILVDGEAFSWYGTRLIKSIAYFKSLVHRL